MTDGLADTTDKGEITTASSGNETDTDVDTFIEKPSQKKKKVFRHYPTLIDTVALNYLGIMMLRRPLSLAQMLRLVLPNEAFTYGEHLRAMLKKSLMACWMCRFQHERHGQTAREMTRDTHPVLPILC